MDCNFQRDASFSLLETERQKYSAKPTQQWLGFMASTVPSVRMPKSIRLANDVGHASLGVYVLVRNKNDRASWTVRSKIGFDQLRHSVAVSESIACGEEAAIVAFVFFHDHDAEQSAINLGPNSLNSE